MLYVFRSIAGMGGGGMTNLSMVIVSDVVSLEERGRFDRNLLEALDCRADLNHFLSYVF